MSNHYQEPVGPFQRTEQPVKPERFWVESDSSSHGYAYRNRQGIDGRLIKEVYVGPDWVALQLTKYVETPFVDPSEVWEKLSDWQKRLVHHKAVHQALTYEEQLISEEIIREYRSQVATGEEPFYRYDDDMPDSVIPPDESSSLWRETTSEGVLVPMGEVGHVLPQFATGIRFDSERLPPIQPEVAAAIGATRHIHDKTTRELATKARTSEILLRVYPFGVPLVHQDCCSWEHCFDQDGDDIESSPEASSEAIASAEKIVRSAEACVQSYLYSRPIDRIDSWVELTDEHIDSYYTPISLTIDREKFKAITMGNLRLCLRARMKNTSLALIHQMKSS